MSELDLRITGWTGLKNAQDWTDGVVSSVSN